MDPQVTRIGTTAATLLAATTMATGCATLRGASGQPWPFAGVATERFAAPGGYDQAEAVQFVEFCVELDSQDDRESHPGEIRYKAQVDTAEWKLVYDSRSAVDRDYFEYKRRPRAPSGTDVADDDLGRWAKLYDEIDRTAASRKIPLRQEGDVARNAVLNGFGPWQNAWLLYEGVGRNSGRHAIAIRGTVFAAEPSAIEDAIFQPVLGREFLSRKVSYSQNGAAQLHGGFAHAVFTLLLDRRYGVLEILKEHQVAPESMLYVVGHSQGAAMATIVHAFFVNAMSAAEAGPEDPLGLRGSRYRLKSYAFAQPKPGNYAFAAEFAGYTQRPDNALVVNNHIDPVPKVPMTLESTADLDTDFHGHLLVARIVHSLGWPGKMLRSVVSGIADWFTRKSAEGYGNFYHWDAIKPLHEVASGASWDFVPAGRVIFVYGSAQDAPKDDTFYQHHSTTYRDLIRAQLGPLASNRQ